MKILLSEEICGPKPTCNVLKINFFLLLFGEFFFGRKSWEEKLPTITREKIVTETDSSA